MFTSSAYGAFSALRSVRCMSAPGNCMPACHRDCDRSVPCRGPALPRGATSGWDPRDPQRREASRRIPGLGRSRVRATPGDGSTCPARQKGEPPDVCGSLCGFILRGEVKSPRAPVVPGSFYNWYKGARPRESTCYSDAPPVEDSTDIPGFGDHHEPENEALADAARQGRRRRPLRHGGPDSRCFAWLRRSSRRPASMRSRNDLGFRPRPGFTFR